MSKQCAVCPVEFEPVNGNQKYCSDSCKQLQKDLNYGAKLGLFCAVCGKPMRAVRGGPPRKPGAAHFSCREIIHGSDYGYKKGCRCPPCRVAHNAKLRTDMIGIRLRHKERTGETYNQTRYRRYEEKYGEPYGQNWITAEDRLAVYERDGWVCGICHEPLDLECGWNEEGAPTLDHVVPRSLGGSDELDNLRAAHRGCNARRGNRV